MKVIVNVFSLHGYHISTNYISQLKHNRITTMLTGFIYKKFACPVNNRVIAKTNKNKSNYKGQKVIL